MPSNTIEDFAYQVRDYMRSAEVVEGKNYFNPSITSGTVKDNITYNVNSDKSISANGTTSADTYIELGKVTLSAGTYMLSGLPMAPHLYDYRLRLTDANEQAIAWDDGEGAEFTISATQELSLRFRYNNNVVVDHITIYTMICTLADWNASHTYEPYYVPVKDRVDELTENKANYSTSTNAATGDAVSYQRVLTSSDDLDNLFQTGIFGVQASPPSNLPSDWGGWGYILSVNMGFRLQFALAPNAIYIRAYGGSPIHWFAWQKISASPIT